MCVVCSFEHNSWDLFDDVSVVRVSCGAPGAAPDLAPLSLAVVFRVVWESGARLLRRAGTMWLLASGARDANSRPL